MLLFQSVCVCVLMNYTVCYTESSLCKWSKMEQLPTVLAFCFHVYEEQSGLLPLLFLILLPQPIEILLRSLVNYLCWKKCNRTQVTFRGGIVLHDKSDRQRFIKEVQCHFACWQAHLKASLPFTKIISIMDKAKSIAVSSHSL